MQPIDIVNEYYLKHGQNEAACAKEYLNSGKNRIVNKSISKIAIYYPRMRTGGVGRVVSLMLPLYAKMNYEVILITEELSDGEYDIPDYVKRYFIVSRRNILDGKNVYKERAVELADIFTKEKVDVFIHHGSHIPLLAYDIILANLMGIYTITERHQVFTEEFCRFKDLFFTQVEIFKIVDKLVVLSGTEELYWKSLGINANYIENPFNTSLLDIKCDSNNENIIWVGRLHSNQKRFFDVLDIAKYVIVKRPTAKFLIYGSGEKAIVEQLDYAIKNEGLESHVFYCGYESDVSKIYQSARIHLVTSAYEAFPMGIYESRILGIPLVMYDLPYLELLKERKGYLSSANGDTKDMAANICMILDDEKLEKRLKIDAKESVRCFNNGVVSDKWEKLLSDIQTGKKETDVNEEFGVIIQTIHKHFSIAQKMYQDLLYKSEKDSVICHISIEAMKGKEIVICPYGNIGKKVKKIINEYGLYERYIVDNNLSKHDSQIKSLEEIRKMDCSNMIFVICTDNRNVKQLFYNEIREFIIEDNIVYYNG